MVIWRVKIYQMCMVVLMWTCGCALELHATHKVPARITTVNGISNQSYALIKTTITKRVAVAKDFRESAATTDIVVTREQLDTIGPNRNSTHLLDVKLELPMPPVAVETYGATQVADKVGHMVGAMGMVAPVDPVTKAALMIGGASLSGIAALVDYSTHVAQQELNTLYENQQFEIILLEIIPMRYYTIDTQTNQIMPTPLFKQEFTLYKNTMKQYLDTLKIYQDVSSIYTQWYQTLVARDPSGSNQAQWGQLRDYDRDVVQSALRNKNSIENQFARMYPPYRIAIMASVARPGNTCRKFGSGPWGINIMYYVGAKQTNKFGVQYCVPNNKSAQTFTVQLAQNQVQQIDRKTAQQKFIPGGIKLVVGSNASFARSTGFNTADYGAQSTNVINWFSHMVTDVAGGSIDQFFVPFNVKTLRNEAAAQINAANKARMDSIITSMDTIIARTQQDNEFINIDGYISIGGSVDNGSIVSIGGSAHMSGLGHMNDAQ